MFHFSFQIHDFPEKLVCWGFINPWQSAILINGRKMFFFSSIVLYVSLCQGYSTDDFLLFFPLLFSFFLFLVGRDCIHVHYDEKFLTCYLHASSQISGPLLYSVTHSNQWISGQRTSGVLHNSRIFVCFIDYQTLCWLIDFVVVFCLKTVWETY